MNFHHQGTGRRRLPLRQELPTQTKTGTKKGEKLAIGTHHIRREKGPGTRRSACANFNARYATDDWVTPPEIIQALGPFDLDPCGCALGQPTKTAAEIWTDGAALLRSWPEEARVWLNPPYHRDMIGPLMARLADHGRGTALVFARTDTVWFFKSVWPKASALLFVEGRLNFYFPDGRRSPSNSGGPSVLIAYGPVDREKLLGSSIRGAKIDRRFEGSFER